MWPLRWFCFDEDIEADEVSLLDSDEEESVVLRKPEAIARAHASGLHLIAWWPLGPGDTTPSCIIGKVAIPLRWEQAPTDPDPVDEELWFEGT